MSEQSQALDYYWGKNSANARGHQPQLHRVIPLLEVVIPFDLLEPNPVIPITKEQHLLSRVC